MFNMFANNKYAHDIYLSKVKIFHEVNTLSLYPKSADYIASHDLFNFSIKGLIQYKLERCMSGIHSEKRKELNLGSDGVLINSVLYPLNSLSDNRCSGTLRIIFKEID